MSGFVSLTGPDGITPLGTSYMLANNITLAANAGTTPVTPVQRATYGLDVVGTFASGAQLQLQAQGADGVTWRNLGAAITAAGTVNATFSVFADSSVRLLNTGTASVTGLYAKLG